MTSLEKRQVVSFLKILQIPTNLSPDKIKHSLLEAGWNEKDADEAVVILHPHTEQQAGQQESSSNARSDQSPASQIVAQRYVQNESDALPKRAKPDDITKAADSAAIKAAETITQELADKAQATDTIERPHADAPWLEHQVDIYDVTPEEREEMIRTVYRTNEKLSPQTIHALLGIDVDLTAFEESYARKHASAQITVGQITIIIILSILLAGFGFVFGMYYFEVGPFHPSMNS